MLVVAPSHPRPDSICIWMVIGVNDAIFIGQDYDRKTLIDGIEAGGLAEFTPVGVGQDGAVISDADGRDDGAVDFKHFVSFGLEGRRQLGRKVGLHFEPHRLQLVVEARPVDGLLERFAEPQVAHDRLSGHGPSSVVACHRSKTAKHSR